MSLSLCSLSSVFFCFDISPHFSPLNGLERSKMVHGGYYPLCMSQMVLKAANSVCIHNGLEMSQFTVLVPNGLERSDLWVLIFSWALTLACHCIL